MDVTTALSRLTAKGRPVMEAIANGEYGWFDNGLVEGSGIWGECINEKPGVLTGLVEQGLLTSSPEDGSKAGNWYALTALGAAVAQALAGPEKAEALVCADEPEQPFEACVDLKGNYNTVFAPAAGLFGQDVRVERVSTMLVQVHCTSEFAARLAELEAAATAALRQWQKTQEGDGQTGMEKYNQNRSFLAGYMAAAAQRATGAKKLPAVAFAKDMEKALRPEAFKAGAAVQKG